MRALVRFIVPIFIMLLAGTAQAGAFTFVTDPQARPRELRDKDLQDNIA